MKTWSNIDRVDVGFSFHTSDQPVGGAATANRRIFFSFDENFVSRQLNPSPVKMKLTTALQAGSSHLDGLPGLLHDSLPDGWSRLVLDRYVRTLGFDPMTLGPLDRLALVGDDGPGALTYRSSMSPSLKPVRVDLDTAAALVSGAPDETDADRVEHALRLTRSLGGARPKAYVYLKNGKFSTGEADGEAWIVKFPAKHDGREAGAVEYAYSLMAAAAGIDTPPAALLPSQDGPGFFAIKRFDRQLSGRRLHMHSFAGLLNATASHNGLGYTELMRVTGALTHKSGTAASSIEEQIRRMAFNVLARNRDDHAKNHAFLMDENGTWRCAPAFDLTYANDSEHALLVGSQGREPTTEDMLSVAREMHVPDDRAKSIIAQVRSAVGDWNRFAAQAGLSAALTADIDHSLNGGGSPDGMSAAFHFINRTGGIGS